MLIDTSLSTDYIFNNTSQGTMEYCVSQADILLNILQNSNISKPMALNIIQQIEITNITRMLQAAFSEFQILKPVIEIAGDNNKVSLIFNTSLPDNLSPDEIGKVNDKAFEIFSKESHSFIDSVMVL